MRSSSDFTRHASYAVLFAAALSLAAAPAGAASTRLSDGHPFSDIDFSSTRPQVSPNGQYVVYRQDAVVDGASELWSVHLPGGEPVRLSDVFTAPHFLAFAISPDSARVVYSTDQDTAGRTELFSVPIGGGVITKLNPNLAASRNVINFQISPASNRVFYVADKAINDRYELYSVPIAGGPAVQINGDLPSNDYDVEGYRATPDGTSVVYRAGRTSLAIWDLFSVPSAGPAESAVKISRLLGPGGAVDLYFQVSPNGSRAIYRADATIDETFNLWSVPIAGGASTQLDSGFPAGESALSDFQLSADGSRVVFLSQNMGSQAANLYSVPATGGTPVRLNGLLQAGESVAKDFAINPAGNRVVYRSDEDADGLDELRSVAITGGTPVKLNGPLVAGGDVIDFAISPNGARVVYRADQAVDTLNELWSAPIGGGAAVKLNRTLASGGDVQSYRIGSDSAWVVYGADQDLDATDELLRAPIAGGTVENVSGALPGGGDVVLTAQQIPAFEIVPGNGYDVVYAADEESNDEVELYLSGAPETEPGNCTATPTRLCLQGRLFEVTVDWTNFVGLDGHGQANELSNESGDFWFFNAQSNELIVKVIDGCGSTGTYWVFWRALSNVEMDLTIRNTETQQTLTYHNPLGFNPNGHLDTATIFHCDGSGPASAHFDTSTDLPAPGVPQILEGLNPALIGPCVPASDHSICLKNGRFRVQGTWSDFSGHSGEAHVIKKNESSGYAWFFNSNNYEMLFKLVDACSLNGNTWVSIAGLTNVAATLTITDTWTGATYRQGNTLSVDFPTDLDIDTNLTYCGPAPF